MKNRTKYLRAPEAFVDRTLSRYVEDGNGCWLYSGSSTRDGYAQANYKLDGRQFSVYPHVLAYLRATGDGIPVGHEVDHACHDPQECVAPCAHRRCINPAHLVAMPARDNNLKSGNPIAANSRKTHCPRGHQYDVHQAEGRRCSECEREKSRRQYLIHGSDDNAKRSEKMRADPEYRERRLTQQRKRASSEEAKAARRERYATDTEYREKVKARVNERTARLRAERSGGSRS